MIAVNSHMEKLETYKVRCPECRGRICDMVIDEEKKCHHSYRIVTDKNSKSHITIKCRKCGIVVGISLFNI